MSRRVSSRRPRRPRHRAPRRTVPSPGTRRPTAGRSTACSANSCHGPGLERMVHAPPLIGVDFLNGWAGRTTDELFAYLRDEMPPGQHVGSTPHPPSGSVRDWRSSSRHGQRTVDRALDTLCTTLGLSAAVVDHRRVVEKDDRSAACIHARPLIPTSLHPGPGPTGVGPARPNRGPCPAGTGSTLLARVLRRGPVTGRNGSLGAASHPPSGIRARDRTNPTSTGPRS